MGHDPASAIVFRSCDGYEKGDSAKQWCRPPGYENHMACIAFRPIIIPDDRRNLISEKIIIVGDFPSLVEATRSLMLEPDPPAGKRLPGTARVLDILGDTTDGAASWLLRNAIACAWLRPDDLDDMRIKRYTEDFYKVLAAYPATDRAMKLASDVLSGKAISDREVSFLDKVLSSTDTRRLCAERGLDTSNLSTALKFDGVQGVDNMLVVWDRAVFSSDLPKDVQEPLPMDNDDVIKLHAAVRIATGEDADSKRPKIFHNEGGCAAFAVVLNKVLGGPGRYVLTGDPARNQCGHVALRVGDFVVDGEGVRKPDAFLRRWGSTASGPRDFYDPTADGLTVRRLAGGDRRLDEVALEQVLSEELRNAGLASTVSHLSA